MEFVTGLEDRKVKTLEELEREESVGTEVTVEGMVHSIRDMGEISFVILRSRDGLLQTVIQAGSEKEVLSEIREGQAVRVTGTVFKEERAPHGIEIHLAAIGIAKNSARTEKPMAQSLRFRSSFISLKNKFLDVISCHLRFTNKDFFQRQRDQLEEQRFARRHLPFYILPRAADSDRRETSPVFCL